MRRLFIAIVVLIELTTIIGLTSCIGETGAKEPKLFTVYSNGMVFKHCKIMMSYSAGVREYLTSDGVAILVSGTYLVVEEK